MEEKSKTKFNAAELMFIVINGDMSFFSSGCQGGGHKHILQSTTLVELLTTHR